MLSGNARYGNLFGFSELLGKAALGVLCDSRHSVTNADSIFTLQTDSHTQGRFYVGPEGP